MSQCHCGNPARQTRTLDVEAEVLGAALALLLIPNSCCLSELSIKKKREREMLYWLVTERSRQPQGWRSQINWWWLHMQGKGESQHIATDSNSRNTERLQTQKRAVYQVCWDGGHHLMSVCPTPTSPASFSQPEHDPRFKRDMVFNIPVL
jgi:hypothetical protein